MRNKYHIYLTYEERRMLLNNLNAFRTKLIAEGKYTDLLDEVIIKVANAKLKLYISISDLCSVLCWSESGTFFEQLDKIICILNATFKGDNINHFVCGVQ